MIKKNTKFKSTILLLTLLMTKTIYGQFCTNNCNYHMSFVQTSNGDEHISMSKPSLSGSFTIETWVRLDVGSCPGNSKPTSNDAFVSIGDHKNSHQGAFGGAEIGIQSYSHSSMWPVYSTNAIAAQAGKFYFIVGDGVGTNASDVEMISSTTTPICNTWYHVAGVYTGTAIEMWVNGVREASVPYSGSIVFANSMTLGREATPTGSRQGYLDGDLDNVAIWNTDKDYTTTSSSSDYYQKEIPPNSTNLVDYYSFNEDWNSRLTNNPVRDATSSANNGTNQSTGNPCTINFCTQYPEYDCNNNNANCVHSSGGPPLPVELLNFELVQNNESVDLFWSTASELNNHFFTLEKSMDGRHWNLLGTVEGNGTTNEISDYTYTDYNPYPIKTFYRLSQTDYDGKFEYLAIKSTNSNDEGIPQMSVRPNPSSNFVNIDYVQFPYSQIRFLNAHGIDVTEEIKVLRNTGNSLTLDISAIQNGVYSVVSPTSSALLIKL